MFRLYSDQGVQVFQKNWRTFFWPLTRYRYPLDLLETALRKEFGDLTMGELWQKDSAIDVVITTFDLLENRTRFIKPWKEEYRDWSVVKAALSSCAVPTFSPIVEG